MTDQKTNILIAGGKTGGHLFPGIAIAKALQRENSNVKILFAGLGTEFETRTVSASGFNHAKLYSKPIKGKNLITLMFSLFIIPLSIFQALLILKKFKPVIVIGTGGFSSFPVVASAWLCGIDTAIQEQNTIPGLTNRILSKIAGAIFLNFQKTKLLSKKSNAFHFGNPVRKTEEQTDQTLENRNKPFFKESSKEQFTILVSGGSQGAKSINKAFVDALNLIDNTDQYRIIHQTGEKDEQYIQAQYLKARIKNSIVQAFFDNLGIYQDMADLIISRAGAGTISEICLKGLPAILIPYPFAADDHQTSNAQELEKINAAIVIRDIDLTGQILKQHIENLKNNAAVLKKMGQASLSIAMPDADIKIARKLLLMAAKQG